jgi:flagellar biosynthesis protein
MAERRREAAALRYDRGKDSAPRIVAKGKGVVADKILEIARRHGIPIREDRELIRMLASLDLYREIPPDLYKAVAEILAFLYSRNRGAGEAGRQGPEKMAYKVLVYGSRKAFPAEGLAVGTRLPFDVFVNEGNVFSKAYSRGIRSARRTDGASAQGRKRGVRGRRDALELDAYLHRTCEEVPANLEDPVTVGNTSSTSSSTTRSTGPSWFRASASGSGSTASPTCGWSPGGAPGQRPRDHPGGISALRGDIVIRNEDIPQYQKYLDAVIAEMADAAPTREEKQKSRPSPSRRSRRRSSRTCWRTRGAARTSRRA